VKPIYNGQPRGKMGFVDSWPLFGTSEATYLS